MARRNKKLRRTIQRHPKTTVAAVVVAGATIGFLALKNNDQAVNSPSYSAPSSQQTSSPAKTGQGGGSAAQGGAVDSRGSSAPSNPHPGAVSESGAISLATPTDGQTVQSGVTVAGTAKGVKEVQFRLVDSSSGVLAQGSLTVVNGKYSGNLYFSPRSSKGKLDIFSYDAKYGTEVNSITISLKLGS